MIPDSAQFRRKGESEIAISSFKLLESRGRRDFQHRHAAVEGAARTARKPNECQLRITIAYWATASRRAARFRRRRA
jgi:hypothetical protein